MLRRFRRVKVFLLISYPLITQQLPISYQITVFNIFLCMYGHTHSTSMDQPGEVANPARGQLNRENEYFPLSEIFR